MSMDSLDYVVEQMGKTEAEGGKRLLHDVDCAYYEYRECTCGFEEECFPYR